MSKLVKLSEKNKDFFEMVYAVVEQIPEGRVTSYGAIAKFLGMARSSRMVGWAMNASHHHECWLPAHRVVNRFGLLTGKHHFSDPQQMKALLEIEKIPIVEDQVQDFDNYFWDPSLELTLD